MSNIYSSAEVDAICTIYLLSCTLALPDRGGIHEYFNSNQSMGKE